MNSLRPLILLTVHRRYFELGRAVKRIRQAVRRGEFLFPPEVWVVWACPEVGRLWFFQRLIKSGRVHRLLTRPPSPHDNTGATTIPESMNLRLGLEAARDSYDDVYIIGQAADVLPHPDTYRFIDSEIQGGARAVLFHWQNGFANAGVWHTNFFAVPLDPSYWPPVATPHDMDVLERQWGRALEEARLPGVKRSHNSRCKKFEHAHLSESRPPHPFLPQHASSPLPLTLSGHRPWHERLVRRLKGLPL